MEPLVFDGVGTVTITDTDGNLKLLDMKVNSVTAQLQIDWEKVMGGDSGYAFHYTAKDLGDKFSMEVPRYSPGLAEISQGAETISGSVTFDETVEAILVPTDGHTLEHGATLVLLSDKVYLKDDSTGVLTLLDRVTETPAADEYMITSGGKITSNSSNDGKTIVVMYKWTKASGTKNTFSGTRRPKAFKLVHRFTLVDDKTRADVPCQLTIHKALGGGVLDVSQKRKSPSTSTISLEVMEPDLTADNPNRVAVELIFGI